MDEYNAFFCLSNCNVFKFAAYNMSLLLIFSLFYF